MNTIITSNVRRLALEKGINSVVALARETKNQDPHGKGVSSNSLKRYWFNDPSLTSYNRNVILMICRALNCEPGEFLQVIGTQHQQRETLKTQTLP